MSVGLWAVVLVAYVVSVAIAYRVGMMAADGDRDRTNDLAHVAELSAAFNRGVEAGERRAADAARAKRSAAGAKAAATRRERGATVGELPHLSELATANEAMLRRMDGGPMPGGVSTASGTQMNDTTGVTITNAYAPFTFKAPADGIPMSGAPFTEESVRRQWAGWSADAPAERAD